MKTTVLKDYGSKKHLKSIRFLLLFAANIILSLNVLGQAPVWVTIPPSVGTTGPLSIPVNFGIDRTGTVYIGVYNYINETVLTSQAVKNIAISGPSGTLVSTAVVPVSQANVNTIITQNFEDLEAGQLHTIYIVAESSSGVLQATPVRLTASTTQCPKIDLLTGFTQPVQCINLGTTATFQVVILDPGTSGVLKGTNWLLDWGDGTNANYVSAIDNDLPPLAIRTHSYTSATTCNFIFTITITNPCGEVRSVQYVAIVHGRDIPSDGDGMLSIVNNANGNQTIQVCEGTQTIITLRDNSTWNCQNPTLPGGLTPVPNTDPRNIEWLYGRDPNGAINNTITGTVNVATLGNAPQTSGRITPSPYGPESLSQAISIPATARAGEYFRVYLKNWNKCNWSDPEYVSTYVDIQVVAAPPAPTAPNKNVCVGGDRTLTVTSVPMGTISWYSDASLTNLVGTGTSFLPAPTAPGIYSYWVTDRSIVGEQCRSAATQVILTIGTIPSGAFLTSSGDTCAGAASSWLSAAITGGVGPYNISYTLNGVARPIITSYSNNTHFNLGILPAGSFTFAITQITDNCGNLLSGAGINPVTLQIYQDPVASAGPDQELCGTLTAFLTGNTPTEGQGTWSLISGPGTVNFAPTPGTPNASANVSANGTYVFRWTIRNGISCFANDDVTVRFSSAGQVNRPPDISICNGETLPSVIFSTINTGGVTTYSWNNDNITIGLPASGTGNIPSFNAINPGTFPINATITVIPTFINGFLSCPGPPVTFTIIVNPSAQVNMPNSLTVCSGETVTPIVFTTVNTGGTNTYTWANSNPEIGLPAEGTDNIPPFRAINTNPFPITATIIITPVFHNNTSCSGPPVLFNIIVLPSPDPTVSGPELVCLNSSDNIYSTEPGMLAYNWSVTGGEIIGGEGSNSISVLWNAAGNQTVSVSYGDINGCLADHPALYNVQVGSELSGSIISQTNVSYNDGADGSVTVEGIGGLLPYDYSLDSGPFQPSGTFSFLAAGSYNVTIRDANLCYFALPVIITQPASQLVSVNTSVVSAITSNTAICGGNITGIEESPITARGVCWSTSSNPSTDNYITLDGTGSGEFTSSITGLSPGTAYYIRAYATNGSGTAYGEEFSFRTLDRTDPDECLIRWYPFNGNADEETGFGNDGTVNGAVPADDRFGNTGSAFYFNGSDNFITIPGYLPIDNSYTICFWAFLERQNGYSNIISDGSINYGGNDFLINFRNNDIGIRADKGGLPLNYEYNSPSEIANLSLVNRWVHVAWVMNTSGSVIYLDGVRIADVNVPGTNEGYHDDHVTIGARHVWTGMDNFFQGKLDELRIYNCTLNDQEIFDVYSRDGLPNPTLSTTSVTNITNNSAVSGGNIISDGGSPVIARGVCWSISSAPTISDNITIDGSGTGSFTSSLTGLSTGTRYYLRSYATNSAGTGYGNEITFIAEVPVLVLSGSGDICSGSPSSLRLDITEGTPPFTINFTRDGAAQPVINGYISGSDIDLGILAAGLHTFEITSVVDAESNSISPDNLPSPYSVEIYDIPEASSTLNSSPVICNGGITDIIFHSNVANTDFIYTASYSPSVDWLSGQSPESGIQSNGEGFRLSQNLSHNSDVPVTVTYTIVPQIAGQAICTGIPFTVEVIVNPRPVIGPVLDRTICSDIPAELILEVAPGSVQAEYYNILNVAIEAGLASSPGNALVPAMSVPSDYLVNDRFMNITGNDKNVIYTVQPFYPPDCYGDPVNVVVTIRSQPYILPGQVKSVCSGVAAGKEILLSPANVPAGTMLSWPVPVMSDASVQGTAGINVPADPAGNLHINDVFYNTTNAPVTATYYVTPVSSSGCIGEQMPVVITVNPEPAVNSISGRSRICAGEMNLVYNVIPSAGSGFHWTVDPVIGTKTFDYNTNAIIINASATGGAGNISVYETNPYGCDGEPIIFPVTVSEISVPEIISGPSNVCAYSTQNYSVTSRPGSVYDWKLPAGAFIIGNQTGSSITVLFGNTGGTVSVSEINSAGCITVHNPLAAIVESLPDASITGGPVSCEEAIVPLSVDFTGTGPFTFTYSINGVMQPPVSTSSDPYILNATEEGVYRIVNVSDFKGCTNTGSDSVYVNRYPKPTGTITGGRNLCRDSSTVITMLFTGTPPYTFVYSDGVSQLTVSNHPDSFYNLEVIPAITTTYSLVSLTDAHGCSGELSEPTVVIVNEPPVLNLSGNNLICNDYNTGTVDLTITGSRPFGYTWMGPDGFTAVTEDISGLGAGEYRVTVTDINGCTSSGSVILTEPGQLTAIANFEHLSCFGSADGVISISLPAGGSGSYEYTIDGGMTWQRSGSFTGLAPGTYDVRIRDAMNPVCYRILNASLVITQPPVLSATVSGTNVTCSGGNDGIITISGPSGGYGTYEFSINGGSNWQSSGLFNNLEPGIYDVRMRDAMNTGCTLVLNSALVINISGNASLASTLTPQPVCSGTSFIYNAISTVPGSLIEWTRSSINGIAEAANSGTGNINEVLTNTTSDVVNVTYIFTVTNGTCRSTSSVTVTVYPAPTAIAGGSQTVCLGDSVTVSGASFSNGIILWTSDGEGGLSGSTTLTPTYTPVASDAGKTITLTMTVTGLGTCGSNSATAVYAVTVRREQTISFNPLPDMVYGDPTFNLAASASSSLEVSFSCHDDSVLTISGNTVSIKGAGTATIYAKQSGNNLYCPAAPVSRTLKVNPKPIVVIADSTQSKVYGDTDPELIYLVYPEMVGTDKIKGNLSRESGENVGIDYTVLQGTLDAGHSYEITFVPGRFAIYPKAVAVTPNSGQTKTYGQNDPVLEFTVNPALIGSDKTNGSLGRMPGENAGSYPITGGTLSLGENYTVTFVPDNFIIEKAPLYVSGDQKERRYLESNPVFGISYSGFVAGESVSVLDELPVISALPDTLSDAGEYLITVSGGFDNNYSYNYISGLLTILKADQEIISFNSLPKFLRTTQGFPLEATASSGLEVRFESSDEDKATISGNVMTIVKEGAVNIIAIQDGNKNWNPAPSVYQTVIGQPTFDNVTSLFTPNSDGMNDHWHIVDIDDFGTVEVKVYNRFGKLVYESSDYKNDWKGDFNGSPLPEASYYYIIKSAKRGIVKGVVNIVR